MPKTEVAALLVAAAILIAALPAAAQQVPDTTWSPAGLVPRRAAGTGPHVVIDAAHHNFHTVDGRYRAFADLLRRDGYRVDGSTTPFSAATLGQVDILVVSNAVNARNETDWTLPTPPAFTPAEVEAVREWVREGGSLLLIADHMPFPGGAAPLAAAFGFGFRNGFARAGAELAPITFRPGPVGAGQAGGSLTPHPIVAGFRTGDGVDSLVSFTGSAFQPPAGAEPLLVLPSDAVSLEPAVAWQFDDRTPITPVGGWSQGAVLRHGRGRVAVFGEAAMFSAQLSGTPPEPMGMNSPLAPQNFRFLLNTMAWLAESDGKGSVRNPSAPGATRQRTGR